MHYLNMPVKRKKSDRNFILRHQKYHISKSNGHEQYENNDHAKHAIKIYKNVLKKYFIECDFVFLICFI